MNRITSSVALLALVGCSAAAPSASDGKDAVASSPPAPVSAAQPAAAGPTRPIGLRPEYQHCVDDAAGVVPATEACIGKEFTYQEQRLKTVLDKRLRQADSAVTTSAQASWRKATDARCAWNAADEGQGQRLEANACELEAIAARADELSR